MENQTFENSIDSNSLPRLLEVALKALAEINERGNGTAAALASKALTEIKDLKQLHSDVVGENGLRFVKFIENFDTALKGAEFTHSQRVSIVGLLVNNKVPAATTLKSTSDTRYELQEAVSDFRKSTYEFAQGGNFSDCDRMLESQRAIFTIAMPGLSAPDSNVLNTEKPTSLVVALEDLHAHMQTQGYYNSEGTMPLFKKVVSAISNAKKSEQKSAQLAEVLDRGPWVYETNPSSDFSLRYWLQSEDSRDVRLYINGNFGDDEARAVYANWLADLLNGGGDHA